MNRTEAGQHNSMIIKRAVKVSGEINDNLFHPNNAHNSTAYQSDLVRAHRRTTEPQLAVILAVRTFKRKLGPKQACSTVQIPYIIFFLGVVTLCAFVPNVNTRATHRLVEIAVTKLDPSPQVRPNLDEVCRAGQCRRERRGL